MNSATRKTNDAVRKVHPQDIHSVIAAAFREDAGADTRTATLDEPEHGLTDEALSKVRWPCPRVILPTD